MSIQEKISYIRQKAIEANPSILDLVFGCEGEDVNGIWRMAHHNWEAKEPGKDWFSIFPPEKIIGRPIRLADVLNLPDSFTDKYSNKENKELLWKLCANWNLLQDDLTLQSQETIDFLYSLLNKEE